MPLAGPQVFSTYNTFIVNTITASYLEELKAKDGNLSASKHHCGLELEAPGVTVRS